MNLNRRLVLAHVLQRHVLLAGENVVQHGVALREGAPLAVLSAHADCMPLADQAGKCQVLGGGPVKWPFTGRHVTPARQQPFQFRVEVETFRNPRQTFQQGGGGGTVQSRVHVGRFLLKSTLEALPASLEGRVAEGEVIAACGDQFRFQQLTPGILDLVGLFPGHLAHFQQAPEVVLANTAAFADDVVHQRLGEGRFVTFVVAEPAIAEHVNHNVAVELAPEVHCQLNHLGNSFRVFPVDVEYRALQHLGDVTCVGGAAPLGGSCGEADLVVDHNVQTAAHRVTLELTHVERFLVHTLADEGRITVNQDRHRRHAVPVLIPVLLRAGSSHGDGIDELKVRRVEAEGQVHLGTRAGNPVT